MRRWTRERLHRRTVTYDGFRRVDGLFDIEAHIVDAKDHDYELLTGVREAGEPVHDMFVRVTIDTALVHLNTIGVDVGAMPMLEAGASHCYSYSIPIPAASIGRGATYKDTAKVRITNFNGHAGTPTRSAIACSGSQSATSRTRSHSPRSAGPPQPRPHCV